MLIFRIRSYLKFLFLSTNAHGVQSPFVFDLVQNCFYDRSRYPQYKLLGNYRKSLLSDDQVIEIEDFGAGSTIFNSNRRKISAIAANSGISQSRAKLLFRVVQYFKPKVILELGTSVGLATAAIAVGNPKSRIITVEGCSQSAEVAKKYFDQFGFKHVSAVNSVFETVLPELGESSFDLIYFDGNHRKDATLKYFNALIPTAANDAVWIFDDIHWSPDMESAWEIIKDHPSVTVTIDTFQWGFVFFRKEQRKENFTIRI